MIISLDTESTGLDLAHGAKPFLVTTCDMDGVTRFWEWDVDPLTRQPQIVEEDLWEITELLDAAELIYLHNSKFDVRGLATIGVEVPWSKVRDTLIASHLLSTNTSHKLEDLTEQYLGIPIKKYEKIIKEATQSCRVLVKREFKNWGIAEEGKPGMPSVKGSSKRDEDKPWKNDMWLPRALLKVRERESSWLTACSDYANADSAHTLLLGIELEQRLRENKLWKIYEHRLHLPRVDCGMETFGVTARGDYTDATVQQYEEHVAEAEYELASIAAGYGHNLELAAGASLNDNMRDFFYGAVWQECSSCDYKKRIKHWADGEANGAICPKCMKGNRRQVGAARKLTTRRRDNLMLPVISTAKVAASLDASTMQDYLATTEDNAHDFIQLLIDKRQYDTSLGYMAQYRRHWIPVQGHPGFYRIHTHINPCGTDHLRQSSNSPNMQNVSSSSKELSNRGCFGPAPGREWWDLDFRSIERRIPPYECGEPKMIAVFEKPDEPPYWGSLYYLTASVLYPDEFWKRSQDRDRFKKEQPRLYKQAKFFDLAKQYGAGRKKGDLLSKVKNSYDLVDNEFPLLSTLQAKYLRDAETIGYVETLPDRTVDPDRGYPILASRTDDGRVLSTTPFNYHVSGTACWVKNTALIRCEDQLMAWRAEGFDAWMALEVHDSILFDFPRGATMEENLPRARILQGLMEQSGENLIPRIPSPVSVEYHSESWAKGVAV